MKLLLLILESIHFSLENENGSIKIYNGHFKQVLSREVDAIMLFVKWLKCIFAHRYEIMRLPMSMVRLNPLLDTNINQC